MNKVAPIQPSCILGQPPAGLFLRGCTKMSRMGTPKTGRPLKNDESHFGLSMFLKRMYLGPQNPLNPLHAGQLLTCRSRWFCFHVGRPSSLSIKDVDIEYAKDPFIRLLGELCKTVSRSNNEIYGQSHESLLHMWRVARSIIHDLRGHELQMQQALGFGLNAGIQPGSLGVCQTIFITCKVKHTIMTVRATDQYQCTIILSFWSSAPF